MAERAFADKKNMNWEDLVDSEASETSEIWRRKRSSLASATSEILNFCTFEKPWRERESWASAGIQWRADCKARLIGHRIKKLAGEAQTWIWNSCSIAVWGCKKLLCLHRMLWGCAQYLKTCHHAYPKSIQVHTPYDPAIANFSIQTSWWKKTDHTRSNHAALWSSSSPQRYTSQETPVKVAEKWWFSANSGHCLSVQLHWC